MKNSPLFSIDVDHEMDSNNKFSFQNNHIKQSEILCITTFPPRECGIATYSQDLISALKNKFKKSLSLKMVALELQNEKHIYTEDLFDILETDNQNSYVALAEKINENKTIEIVMIQHEFGLFHGNEDDFILFLKAINKPIIVVFHTVLPRPDDKFRQLVQDIDGVAASFIVMTKNAAEILHDDYAVVQGKITVIPHGTHLVKHTDKKVLKEKYNLSGRKIISTFGLLSSGKCIETTIDALQSIVAKEPDVLFLVIGKTHPTVVRHEGEKYRNFLKEKIDQLQLHNNVQFVDEYLPLDRLLEYLQLTDVYLFTSKDRNQAVSGTFSYAISCGCPIISTPIPHAIEVLKDGTGIIVDFENPEQLAENVIKLLGNEQLRKDIALNGIHKLAPTAWENAAIAHATLFEKTAKKEINLHYKMPEVNLHHFKEMTTSFAMIQFSKVNQPDLASGYTLDDNARALVAMCQHYELTQSQDDLIYIERYFNFIKFCFQPDGTFLNYVDIDKNFTDQNSENLDDANGRAIWALGYLISMGDTLPKELITAAIMLMQKALFTVSQITSTRAMAFIIKGIYYSNLYTKSSQNIPLLILFSNKIVQMYKHEAKENWLWFEGYLTYANSILPESMLCAYLATGINTYKEIANTSFDFLLSKIYTNKNIKVISNQGWLTKGDDLNLEKVGGEQPIDVAYTILALNKFYAVFKDEKYLQKMEIGFSWFLGNNHLHQIIYNPCTGGCYDGLEKEYINLNQGAESTVSYLMARLTMEKNALRKTQSNRSFLVRKKEKMVVIR